MANVGVETGFGIIAEQKARWRAAVSVRREARR